VRTVFLSVGFRFAESEFRSKFITSVRPSAPARGKTYGFTGIKTLVLFTLARTLIMTDLNTDSEEMYKTRLLGHQMYSPRFCTCLHVCTTSNVPVFMGSLEWLVKFVPRASQHEI